MDKLFCSKCHLRIWRHADNRPLVDMYFQDRHFNCSFALGARNPMVAGEPDPSYTEKAESKRGETVK